MARTHSRQKPICVGVIGVRRGQTFMRSAEIAGMNPVAICDTWEDRLKAVGEVAPSKETMAYAKGIWAKQGYIE